MRLLILLVLSAPLVVLAQTPGKASRKEKPAASARASSASDTQGATEKALQEKLARIAASGRVQLIGENPAARLQPSAPLAPGAPPILAFRYFDGQARHRFGDLDLVMDDAGH